MRIYDIIANKRDGKALSKEEIEFFIQGYLSGAIKDYQISALLMAIYLNGMNDEETAELTLAMAQSGDLVDLSHINGIKVDKHSTGGVGDKTTLIISPIVASLGVKVAKMSGRGLGHTGGTVDKMEAIPGLKMDLARDEFLKIVDEIGLSIISQSGNLATADKLLYALRDVTATVDSIPLIASSIMSKKIAAGADGILLDVKTGSGAFMKSIEDASILARTMVGIGNKLGRKTMALITNMDRPLGMAIGNSLEIIEVCETLKGRGPADLTELCLELAARMLLLAGHHDIETCRDLAKKAIKDGSAFEKLKQMVKAQGGDISFLEDCGKFEQANVSRDAFLAESGFISAMNTEKIGRAAVILGTGRETKESRIDYSAGIIFCKKIGDFVTKGEKIATIFSSSSKLCESAEKLIISSVELSQNSIPVAPIILEDITLE
jgi:pyrimidine-nucleoside phosphorylase